ncbi:MAG: POT family MFS transporter [Phycisphaerae bacterium]|nr:POT family MFS transporter [Phycisphaerae bacterium]
MAESKYLTAPIATTKTPPGIPYILTNEAAERFAFYGTRCILTVFMTQYLLGRGGALDPLNPEQSKTWFHMFVSLVYFMPLVGALISDIWLGKYRTIVIFNLVYCAGFVALVVDQTRVGLFAGLLLIAVGSGIIKPCVSANVGDQFGKTNQHLLSRMYAWFYFAINVGAVFSSLLVPELLKRFGPRIAFGVPGALMFLATLAFWAGNREMVHIPAGGVGFLKETFSAQGVKALLKLSVLYIFIAPFWSLYDQMDSAWVLQAEQMNRHWLGREWLSSQIVAANPFLIIIGIPIFSYAIYPAINKVFRLTPLRKITIGLFVAAFSWVVAGWSQTRIDAGGAPSVGWLFLAYVFLTSAEIMVSITCLEFSYKQAPKKMKAFIMSVFFMSITVGNLFTAVVNKFIQNSDGTSKLAGADYYWFFVGVMAVTAVLFIFVAMAYREKTYIQDEISADKPE